MTNPAQAFRHFAIVDAVLDPDQVAELEAVKAYHGLGTSHDTLRFLIHQEARRIYFRAAMPGLQPAQESTP
jgi:hypothetical protein